jgi:rare lipoprotein A
MRSRLAGSLVRPVRIGWPLAVVAVVCGCASGPRPGADGPGARPPADLATRPDAEPRVEAIRAGGPNKPYQALGRTYVPETRDVPFSERGLASWYGTKFHGRSTSSGEPYDMYAMTAAHPTLPIPSYARIRNPANGREVVVRINDRGPFVAGRIVDLSYAAASKLDLLRGVAPVELERITFDDIRTGAWRGNGATREAAAPPPAIVAEAPPPAPIPTPTPSPPVAVPVPTQDVAFASTAPAATPAPVARPTDAPAPGFWVQLGAFRERDGAESFRRRIGADADAGWLEPLLAIVADPTLYRVQAGPYRSRDEAESAASRVRATLAIVPVVVERR